MTNYLFKIARNKFFNISIRSIISKIYYTYWKIRLINYRSRNNFDFDWNSQNFNRTALLNFIISCNSKKYNTNYLEIGCQNNLNLLDEFPIIYFNCLIESPDKRKLLKKIEIDYKRKKEKLLLKVDGNLNILNNKINFDNLIVNNIKSSQDDLNYYKTSFENIIFNKNILKIFYLSKIRKFIIEKS